MSVGKSVIYLTVHISLRDKQPINLMFRFKVIGYTLLNTVLWIFPLVMFPRELEKGELSLTDSRPRAFQLAFQLKYVLYF